MSFQLPTAESRANRGEAPRWSGAAVLVESMLLLVFLIASLAVFTQMFSVSLTRAEQSSSLTAAVAAASDTAERFAAYPDQVAGEQVVGDLRVVCDVNAEQRLSGTLWHADIAVFAADANADDADDADDAEPIYTLHTSRFESEVE